MSALVRPEKKVKSAAAPRAVWDTIVSIIKAVESFGLAKTVGTACKFQV